MKQFRLSIAVLLSVWSLAGMGDAKADNGSGVSGVKVEKSESKKVRLYTPTNVAPSGAPVEVVLIDAAGTVLYRGSVPAAKQHVTSFNLANLPDGQYYLTASSTDWWMSQGLSIRNNTLTVDERNLQQLTQPTVTAYEKNKVEVTLPATNISDASVAIYDDRNVMVYSEPISSSVRRFDLSSLPEGSYTFVVGPEQKRFSSRINVRR
ncbi:T9SS C-terminal target domain-containing protein [Spirosoma taeanense]|uniref:T9SS C-terminal target domain-containing protein n=1 Tax=Spirosoma taeanense TaxID=2735870 RepID=A0A6M5Y917_9BACT|nr:T9SS C-terminal target domain-containing protein [Spirosoma taeanense]QJW90485.1 T9SS C-terminal target domain-containing protein [Spirosoma taeanense]